MLESLGFTFNNIASTPLGIINCRVSGGLFEETFLSSVEILETIIRGRDKPYFQGVKRQPLSFKLTFGFEEIWTESKIREVARTFFVDRYAPFIFTDFPNLVFYAMITGDSSLFHNGCKSGYAELNFRCDSPYGYFLPITATYTSIGATPTIITITNNGDLPIKPEIEITKIGAGSVSILNSTNGDSFILNNITNNEIIYLNCDTEQIISDLAGIYRYSDFIGDFIELLIGNNSLTITGTCNLEVRYEPKLLQS